MSFTSLVVPKLNKYYTLDRTINEGDIFKHFKGDFYQVLTVAKHTETGEEMVVYCSLRTYMNGKAIWVRSKDMFLSEVDREKYPYAEQEYRFVKVELVGGDEVIHELD